MSIIISNMSTPLGCQKCKFFRKHLSINGLDYSYSCILGAKDFPMSWIRQVEEKASDCPIESSEQEPILDKIVAEIEQVVVEESTEDLKWSLGLKYAIKIIDKYRKEQTNADSN